MNSEKVGIRAMELFGEDGLFCAESVLYAMAEAVGVDSALIPRIASGFCGGIAHTCNMCGAVSGGVMALGLCHGRDGAGEPIDLVYDEVQRFLRAFGEEFGSVDCRELTGCDLGTDAGREAFRTGGIAERCRTLTGRAAAMVAGIVADSGIDAGFEERDR